MPCTRLRSILAVPLLLRVFCAAHAEPSFLTFPPLNANVDGFALPFLNHEAIPAASGLTLAPCTELSGCAAERQCLMNTAKGPVPCVDGEGFCSCRPTALQKCTDTKECDLGDQCVSVGTTAICVSAIVAAYNQNLKSVGTDVEFKFGGLTFDPCSSSDTCDAGRQCTLLSTDNTKEACTEGQKCYCFPDEINDCLKTSQCELGEVCAVMKDVPTPFCVSKVAEIHVLTVSEMKAISGQGDSAPEASPESLVPPRKLRGVTLDSCFTDPHCLGGRSCKYKETPCAGRKGCYCEPESFKPCESSFDCETRELCTTYTKDPESNPFCASAVVIGFSTDFKEVKTGSGRPDSSSSTGLTSYPCSDDSICKSGRKCRINSAQGFVDCAGNTGCMCLPNIPTACSSTNDCLDGEVCSVVLDKGQTHRVCVSADVEASSPEVVEVSRDPKHFPKVPEEDGQKGSEPGGVTFDPCKDSDDCIAPRKCESSSSLGSCNGQDGCYCVPPEPKLCNGMNECSVREVCGKRQNETTYACVSPYFATGANFELIKTGTPQEKSKAAGLTFFLCSSDSDCKGARQCKSLSAEAQPTDCKDGDVCYCLPTGTAPSCKTHSDCDQGAVCTELVREEGAPPFLPNETCIASDAVAGIRFFKILDDDSGKPGAEQEPDDDNSPVLDGVTFDPCKKSKECAGVRTCLTAASKAPCTGNKTCICYPPKPKTCAYSTDCEPRETCALLKGETDYSCISTIYATSNPTVTLVASDKPRTNTSTSVGLTMYPCKTNDTCIGGRTCQSISDNGTTASCTKAVGCYCLPQTKPPPCKEHSDCVKGEVCSSPTAKGVVLGDLPEQVCVAADVEAANPFLTAIPKKEVPVAPDSTSSGVTLDQCGKNEDCAATRTCVVGLQSQLPCNGKENCLCWPSQLRSCVSHTQCQPQEVCATGISAGKQYCVSVVVEGFSTDIQKITTGPPKVQHSESLGLTGWPCSGNENVCKGERLCVGEDGDKLVACANRDSCYCYPKENSTCSKDVECQNGEVCAKVVAEDRPSAIPDQLCIATDVEASLEFIQGVSAGNKAVVNATVTPTPSVCQVPTPTSSRSPKVSELTEPTASHVPETSPESSLEPTESPSPTVSPTPSRPASSGTTDGVCIDARALEHIPRDELVFEKHSMAEVLCDINNSCATPGHIVTFKNKPMMMKSYCALASCEKKEMLVNSPKFKVQLRVNSNTEGLKYTAFAARYETIAEEAVMRAAVHVGL